MKFSASTADVNANLPEYPMYAAKSSIRRLCFGAFLTSLLSASQALEIQAPPTASPWSARVQLSSLQTHLSLPNARSARLQVRGLKLLGDYYFTGSGLGADIHGGLRATGGLIIGPLNLSQAHSGLSLGHSSLLLPQSLGASDMSSALSYLGLGYSGNSLRHGLSFSADLGLVARSGLRLGIIPATNVEDLLQQVRFMPVLQVGLSYRF